MKTLQPPIFDEMSTQEFYEWICSCNPDAVALSWELLPEECRIPWEKHRQYHIQLQRTTFTSLQSYQSDVKRTCATTDQQETLKMALIGLMGELGEIAEPIKKHLYGGHDLDTPHMEQEVGDLLWYLATLCNALNISLEDAMQGNISKLQKRYPDGFSSERSRNR